MANFANPLPYLLKRECGLLEHVKPELFKHRLDAAKNLYRRDLVCHYGCVNAIEFSNNGELLVSGGDDRRVMLWQFGKAIMERGQPEPMKGVHQSNIFCLGITNNNQKIYSGGNDDLVIVHDAESKCPLEVLMHQRAVCGLSIDPFNDRVVATAGNDGRLLLFDTRHSVHESLVISRSRKAFHGVMYHPTQLGMLVSANTRDGVALWDLRATKHGVVRYTGSNGSSQNCMSVRFNSSGSHILALRRRQAPVLYNVNSTAPVAQFYHRDYYNSCTMKSCSFAGADDEYVLSGSDDFNVYMWRVPGAAAAASTRSDDVTQPVCVEPQCVLSGHRSIVNQVRYNPHYCLLASSGVEKIIKIWSAMEYPGMQGSLMESQGSDKPREIYSMEEYVSLVHHSGGQLINHSYTEQCTSEDPRMMAFFDTLVQREVECVGEETDSLAGSSSNASHHHSDSSDSERIAAPDFLPLPPKRVNGNVGRNQRGVHRLARLVPSRCTKSLLRSYKRDTFRRAKQSRPSLVKSTGICISTASTKGKRAAVRRARRPPPPRSVPRAPAASRLSAPSSERTDSDEPKRCLFRNSLARPLRRRMTLTRTTKRKSKCTSYRRCMNLRSNGATQDSSDNCQNNLDGFHDHLAQPSTSSGYRGDNTSSLFRIAEVDSDDDQSAGSRPISPHTSNTPQNLVSIISTPLNGSRDSDNPFRVEEPSESDTSTQQNIRVLRRARRNGRLSLSLHQSESSETVKVETNPVEQLSPKPMPRLMNETNESELESSCSTESSLWPGPSAQVTPDSGVGTNAGSSTRTQPPVDDASDDSEYQIIKFRQRVKKARRNYRSHMDSDSN